MARISTGATVPAAGRGRASARSRSSARAASSTTSSNRQPSTTTSTAAAVAVRRAERQTAAARPVGARPAAGRLGDPASMTSADVVAPDAPTRRRRSARGSGVIASSRPPVDGRGAGRRRATPAEPARVFAQDAPVGVGRLGASAARDLGRRAPPAAADVRRARAAAGSQRSATQSVDRSRRRGRTGSRTQRAVERQRRLDAADSTSSSARAQPGDRRRAVRPRRP